MEVWWSDRPGKWTEARSIRWRPDPSRPRAEWAVSLDRLPHWDGRTVRRVRLTLREAGTIDDGAPRLIR